MWNLFQLFSLCIVVGHYSRDFEKKRRILWNQELYTVAFLITFGHAIRYNEMANQNT